MKIFSEVLIDPVLPLDEVARILEAALGVKFVEETTGRYEERHPAYEARVLGFVVSLLGPPEEEFRRDEWDNYYLLSVDSVKPFGEGCKIVERTFGTPGHKETTYVLRAVPYETDTVIGVASTVDISPFLLGLVTEKTGLAAKLSPPT